MSRSARIIKSRFEGMPCMLSHSLCYRWMLDYDDGESPNAVYIHNVTNRQLGCYTLQSGFQPSWSLPCYL